MGSFASLGHHANGWIRVLLFTRDKERYQRERAWKKYQHVNYLQRINYLYKNTSPLITVNYKCNIIKANEIIKTHLD